MEDLATKTTNFLGLKCSVFYVFQLLYLQKVICLLGMDSVVLYIPRMYKAAVLFSALKRGNLSV